MTLEIRQRRWGSKTYFAFGEDKLHYRVDEHDGGSEIQIGYASIARSGGTRIEKNEWLRTAGLIWMTIGVVHLLGAGFGQSAPPVSQSLWLVIGLACLVLHRALQTSYTVLRSVEGTLFVMHDRLHDRILEEIARRRRRQLLASHGSIDLRNDPQCEMDKFNWLAEEEVITRAEARSKIEQLRQLVKTRPSIDALDLVPDVASAHALH